ncbi:MAG: secretin N-terminal domain-containing protein [Candidatus Omnitrophota bacterium]
MAVWITALFIVCVAHDHRGGVSRAEDALPIELKEKLGRKIDLDLRDMDVVDVYKFLAVKGDFNISISKNIAGRVTLYLKNVNIKDSLDIISTANAIGYKIMGDSIIYVMAEAEYMAMYGKKFSDKTCLKIVYLNYAKPSYVLEALKNIKSEIGKVVIDEDTGSVVLIDTAEKIKQMEEAILRLDHPLETKVFDLRYANAEDVANKLKEKLDNKAVGSVQGDARSNQLVVRALPDRLKEVGLIIASLDKKTKAVLIDVRILKVVFNPKLDMGINWESVLEKGGKSLLTFSGTFPIASVAGAGRILVTPAGGEALTADIKMLKHVVDTKVLANPSILITNNKEARIHIGDKLAYVTTTTIGTGESQRVNEEIHYIDVGVQFKVTPTINDDGFITMAIKPEISSKSGELVTPQGSKVPLVNTTLVETNVIVKDSQTIIIGGLKKDELIKTRRGYPGLMDIPVVGTVFSNIAKDKTQTEIVILLTPHIVEGDENAADKKFSLEQKLKPDKKY